MKNKKMIIIIVAAVAAAALLVGAGVLIGMNIGEKPEVTEGTVYAERGDFIEDYNFLARLAQHPERYTDTLSEAYEMDVKTVESFYECPENWLLYQQNISIHNESNETITVYGYEVKKNGKNGVYISTKSGGELTIAPGETGADALTALCDNTDISTDEAKALVDDFEIKVIYTKTPTENDDGTESVEETKKAPLAEATTITAE